MNQRTYICIDLKSFYASVECKERGLDPFTTNLVVADPERTDKTICLAVSPAMKKLGVPGRCRVFEIPKHIEYIMAPPRMQLYIDYAAEIYAIYLKYIAKEDIHVYSIDEAFFDVTDYLTMYRMTPKELGIQMMNDVFQSTGITATCGIGTNLYLAKVALDITAKHVPDHIGELNEEEYCRTLWNHKPITDFWRVGAGVAKRLQSIGINTMGGIAKADEDMLYKLFGVDAELLIDHAWGRETTLMSDIKNYKAQSNSLGSGQVLGCDCDYDAGRLIVKEMVDLLCLEMVEKGLVTDSITLHIGYNKLFNMKSAHGTIRMTVTTNSARIMRDYAVRLYERIMDKKTPIRRFTVTFNNVIDEVYQQYDLFTDIEEIEREHKLQKAVLDIKEKFGKNAVLKGMNLQKGATTVEKEIVRLEGIEVENRAKMSREDRAKQFMPFAALKGYTEALQKKEKVVVPKAEVSEEYAEELDRKLRSIRKNEIVTVVYFCNGEYLKKTGMVTRIDETARVLKIVNTKISFDDIYQLGM